ncbi:hypothetical protein PGT21_008131 [Puccinia graminis f. sp. tritici]|uniref:Uncharacterized protein n=1 Tax=Puccinia graminis f. sp. tritici TaxID=56615 RepID=A0A5B0QMD3_PUCGR|nr:hypothetical protein PGT21_008131 [Puccinia graminis f. sp. tritici]
MMINQTTQNSFILKLAFLQAPLIAYLARTTASLLDWDTGKNCYEMDNAVIDTEPGFWNLNHNTSPSPFPPLSPRLEQESFFEKQSEADNAWFEHEFPSFFSGSPESLTTKSSVSEPISLENQHSTSSASISHFPSSSNQLRVEDYLEDNLVELSANQIRSGWEILPSHFESLTNPAMSTTTPERRLWEEQQYNPPEAGHASVTSSTKPHEEPNNGSLSRKRIALFDSPPFRDSKKLRISPKEIVNSKAKISSSSLVAQHSNIQEEGIENCDEIISPFDIQLSVYGCISSLVFPGYMIWRQKRLFDTNVLHSSGFWANLKTTNKYSTLPILIEEIINKCEKNRSEIILERTRSLLDEIFFRSGQFLITFTIGKMAYKMKKFGTETQEVLVLRSIEQEKLLEWLTILMSSQLFQPADLQDGAHSLILLHKILFEYLTTEEVSSDLLKTASNIYHPKEQGEMNYFNALKTRIAINTLIIYYKYSNMVKWKQLFPLDHYFVNLFAFLKQTEHHFHFARAKRIHLDPWEKMQVFPWVERQNMSADSIGGGAISKIGIVKNFKSAMKRNRWNTLLKYVEKNE